MRPSVAPAIDYALPRRLFELVSPLHAKVYGLYGRASTRNWEFLSSRPGQLWGVAGVCEKIVRLGGTKLYPAPLICGNAPISAMPPSKPYHLVATLAQSSGIRLRRFFFTRVRNAADIPDLIQEVFLRMLRMPENESIRNPEAYLFTIAAHVAQQHGAIPSFSCGPEETNRVRGIPPYDRAPFPVLNAL